MQIIERNIRDIIPYENNPRKNEAAVEVVMKSIRDFGFKVPIVVDKDGIIVTGHTRLKAAQRLGLSTVPVIVAEDLSDEKIKAFRLADNKTAEYAEWDLEKLEQELRELQDLDIDMAEFGFKLEMEAEEDNFDLEEALEAVAAAPRTKAGDVWRWRQRRTTSIWRKPWKRWQPHPGPKQATSGSLAGTGWCAGTARRRPTWRS
jgi:site-specific DNA-methyltransferase (adenine-specific)